MFIMCVRCSVLRLCSQYRRAHDLNISAWARRVCPRARATRVCEWWVQLYNFRTTIYSTINMYNLIKIRQNMLMEIHTMLKKFKNMLEMYILRNCLQKDMGVLRRVWVSVGPITDYYNRSVASFFFTDLSTTKLAIDNNRKRWYLVTKNSSN